MTYLVGERVIETTTWTFTGGAYLSKVEVHSKNSNRTLALGTFDRALEIAANFACMGAVEIASKLPRER